MSLRDDNIKARQKSAEKVPSGFKTTDQWAEEEGLHRSYTGTILARLAKQGVYEMKVFRIAVGNSIRSIKHYRRK